MSEAYISPTHTPESQKARPAKPPFGYYGAKWRIAKRIIEGLPPHNAWVECFCGSAALTLAKEPVPIEVINDADGEIVNVFEQLRSHSNALCAAVALTPYSREEYLSARLRKPGLPALERARRFLVTAMMTVNATIGEKRSGFSFSQSYTREGKEARVNRWYNLPDRLQKVVDRLRGVRVENRDACELIGMFADRPATLMYLDPPYFVRRAHKYAVDPSTRDWHTYLLQACKMARCMVLISGYANPLYDEMLTSKEGWTRQAIETHTRDTTGKDYARTEILWKNSLFREAERSGVVPVVLTSKEVRQQKVNPPRQDIGGCRGT